MFDYPLSAQAVLFMLYAFFFNVFMLDIVEAVCINDFGFGISV